MPHLGPPGMHGLSGKKLGYNFVEGKKPFFYPIHGPLPLG